MARVPNVMDTQVPVPPNPKKLVRVSRMAAVWSLGYGIYRAYYALGGTSGMLGTPNSVAQWQRINAIAGVLLFMAALLPFVMMRGWWSRPARPVLLAICWGIAVACVSHAFIGIAQRLLSLTGMLVISYPFWESIDPRQADLQALLFNEPWFMIEGVLWGVIAWNGALSSSPRRSWWVGSAVAAIAALTTIGLLSSFGVIGQVIVG